ncbi:MAG: PhzF family phenazine biosynthesis protein [Deltaproteobacteria bacterium]|nr:PhzF family phenazine biosynthesis protein [Deltaproteobacteria bacterium]
MKTFIVDSFTEEPFKGNPAGVCFVDGYLEPDRMILIAQELNLSETAFIQPTSSNGNFSIRYFSPKMEIPLCGHATLASAQVVFMTEGIKEAQFKTSEGLNLTTKELDGQIVLEFPLYKTEPAEAPPALLAALGIDTIVNAAYNHETKILLLETGNAQTLASLRPNFGALLQSHDSINGVLVTTATGTGDYDFHSRYFWPWSGTNEDPVTGGTHTFLTPYWSKRLGKAKMKSFQSSQRTGSMEVEIVDRKLFIKSSAVIVFAGELFLNQG